MEFVLSAIFISDSGDKPQKEGDFVIEPLKVDPACFHICGESQTRVDSAKQRINDLISNECSSHCITDDDILSLSDADHQHIADIQKTMGVSIRIESKKDRVSVTIEGLSKDVLKASKEIHEMVRIARDGEELKKKVELAGTVAEWQFMLQGLPFQSFDSMSNFNLEQALEKKLPNVKVTIKGQNYTVTLPSGPATDSQGRTLEIKRIDNLKGKWERVICGNSACFSCLTFTIMHEKIIINLHYEARKNCIQTRFELKDSQVLA